MYFDSEQIDIFDLFSEYKLLTDSYDKWLSWEGGRSWWLCWMTYLNFESSSINFRLLIYLNHISMNFVIFTESLALNFKNLWFMDSVELWKIFNRRHYCGTKIISNVSFRTCQELHSLFCIYLNAQDVNLTRIKWFYVTITWKMTTMRDSIDKNMLKT